MNHVAHRSLHPGGPGWDTLNRPPSEASPVEPPRYRAVIEESIAKKLSNDGKYLSFLDSHLVKYQVEFFPMCLASSKWRTDVILI